jgi:arginyl-tRNA synthetase
MNIFKQIKTIIISEFYNCFGEQAKLIDLEKLTVEPPKDEINGDASSNIAMLSAKALGSNPRAVAEQMAKKLSDIDFFTKIEVAGPGFINLFINNNKIFEILHQIIAIRDFGKSDIGNNEKVNVEFVSSNPTGPLHVGHLRNAVFGNALANTLEFAGFDVTREFYVNDAGSQIIVLGQSCFIRYRELCTGISETIPAGLYPGDYLIDVAKVIYNEHGKSLLSLSEEKRTDFFQIKSVELILEMIKSNLKLLEISFDIFFSEKSLHENHRIEAVIEKLKAKDLLYFGILDAPKEKIPDDWEPREQLLFKSTLFGDDIDRALQKSDGSWTYLSGDIAYLENKISRGYSKLIYVLGSDHGGYEARLKAACSALSDNKVDIDIKITQLVHFVKNGSPVKMSKRSGNFLLAEDVINEVGKDVCCFMMMTRKNDQTIEFDFEKVKETSKNNPVFYIQYAHARVMSVFRVADNGEHKAIIDCYNQNKYDFKIIKNQNLLIFIKKLIQFPRMVELAATHHEPHRIAFYLIDLASNFHYLWSLGKDEPDLRFLNNEEVVLSATNLAILRAFKNTLTNGLKLFNVDPLDNM